eukprot:16440661-Heterocapsa_arctica.AAC.1
MQADGLAKGSVDHTAMLAVVEHCKFIKQGGNLLSLAVPTHADNPNGAGKYSEREALIAPLEKESRREVCHFYDSWKAPRIA